MNPLELRASQLPTQQIKEIMIDLHNNSLKDTVELWKALYNELEKRIGEDAMDEWTDTFYTDKVTTMDTNKQHGGTRSGAGRPSSGLVTSVPVRVTPEVRQELERRAQAQGVGIGEIVRRALCEWLQNIKGETIC